VEDVGDRTGVEGWSDTGVDFGSGIILTSRIEWAENSYVTARWTRSRANYYT
jgi:hypothetical protein